ncbi:hypothetical protein SLS55_010271 [Diplodia seriata]|uniref:Uncharacterized protein n=1 Tax=Diplodia seriata TaxID=420778 RepID=A0ABR3C175_9PEZI
MSASKLDAVKAIRNRLRAPTADERIELVSQMVTAIERDHPDRFPEVLDIVIGVYEASDKFVKEVQTPANMPTVASPICEDESLINSVSTRPPTETSRLIERSRNGVRHSSGSAHESANPNCSCDLCFLLNENRRQVTTVWRNPKRRAISDIGKTAQVTKTSKAAKRAGDDSMAKEPKKASKAKTVAFQDGGEDDDEYPYLKDEKVVRDVDDCSG